MASRAETTAYNFLVHFHFYASFHEGKYVEMVFVLEKAVEPLGCCPRGVSCPAAPRDVEQVQVHKPNLSHSRALVHPSSGSVNNSEMPRTISFPMGKIYSLPKHLNVAGFQ